MNASGPTVTVHTDCRLDWDFRGGKLVSRVGGYRSQLDAFPGYRHDPDLVRDVAGHLAEAMPLAHDVDIYVCSHEGISRTNGWAAYEQIRTDGDADDSWRHIIFLSGKRIPPHPAVTRYVVAHEYGHAALFECARLAFDEWNCDGVLDDYAGARRLDGRPLHASGGRWHRAVEEIAADDFRIHVAGVEPDYWPHDVPTPADHDAHATEDDDLPYGGRIGAFWDTVADVVAPVAGIDTPAR